MFVLNDDMSIYATRGDTVFFTVCATDGSGARYKFKPDDVVRFKAFEKKACENVVAQKDFLITEETEEVNILLTEDDTRFGKIISKPRDYWYEIELNPFTNPQTIIGYDDDGPKVFRLYPESKNIVKDISEEDFYADAELSPTSTNPVQNQAVTRAVANLTKHIDDGLKGVKESVLSEEEALRIRGELRVLDSDVASLKSDFTEHKSAKNPHGTTASDVGALPDTGGTLSGSIQWNDCDMWLAHNDGQNAYRSVLLGGNTFNTGASIYLYGKDNSGKGIFQIAAHDGTNNATLEGKPTGELTWGGKALYGEHNKPSGSYIGNGSATKREINVGKGVGPSFLLVQSPYSSGTIGIIGYYGGAIFDISSGTIKKFTKDALSYDSATGLLTMATSDGVVNNNGITYTYMKA